MLLQPLLMLYPKKHIIGDGDDDDGIGPSINRCYNHHHYHHRTIVTTTLTRTHTDAVLVSVGVWLLLMISFPFIIGDYNISVVESFSVPVITLSSSSSSSSSFTPTTQTNNNILFRDLTMKHHHKYLSIQINLVIQRQQLSKLYSRKNDEDDPFMVTTTEPKERNILDLLFNPYSSTVIPPEIVKDIYIAEGNTTAAKERTQRIILYCSIAFVSILLAFFNGFLTELRTNPPPTTPDGTDITTILETSNINDRTALLLNAFGFGWVTSNGITSFVLTNKIGGILCLLIGGGSGLLAEAEYDTRRINAEKIYTELIKRRQQNAATTITPRKRSSNNESSNSNNNKKAKRRSSSKEAKRLNALSEVTTIAVAATDKSSPDVVSTTTIQSTTSTGRDTNVMNIIGSDNITTLREERDVTTTTTTTSNNKDPNLFDRVKDFYQQADAMAMTQALLMNKELEDKGILPKITDETGLKVIGAKSSIASRSTTNTTTSDDDDK